MREIPLTKGKFALVDDDCVAITQYKWNITGRYAARKSLGKTVLMHRVITNAKKGMDVDHKNGDGLDNRRENLRICSRTQNHANRRTTKSATGLKGVYWEKSHRKFRAYIEKGGRRIRLGSFDEKISAAKAYDKAAIELFGEFAATNAMLGFI